MGLKYHAFQLFGSRFFGRDKETEEAEGARLFKVASEKGHIFATYELGECYYKGEGVEKDLSKAVHYYKLAADQGNAMMRHNLLWEIGIRMKRKISQRLSIIINWQLIPEMQRYNLHWDSVMKREKE